MEKKKRKGVRLAAAVLTTLGVLAAALVSVYMLWERAPEVDLSAAALNPLGRDSAEPARDDPGLPFDTRRQDGQYTILLVGNDDGTGNTDTIMVGRIDTREHTMDFVSIPRDTLIDVDWEIKKINAVYWGAVNSGGSGSEALCRHVKKLIGFDVDCYAVIDLQDFVDVIDAMGGVDFDVPMAMHYEDLSQDLTIHLEPGPQHLDGYQAMGLVRFRSGYLTGDIGRIEMQHQFLAACAKQFISLGKIPNAGKVLEILSDGLDTNLSAANMAWFLRQALRCDSEDIHFFTAPNDPVMIGGYSYAVLHKYEWLNLVNERLNPFDTPVTEENVDIAYGKSDSPATLAAASTQEPEAVIVQAEPAAEDAGPTIRSVEPDDGTVIFWEAEPVEDTQPTEDAQPMEDAQPAEATEDAAVIEFEMPEKTTTEEPLD